MTRRPVRVLFIVSSLCIGGAEKHVVTLANRLDPERFGLFFAYLKPDESLLPQLNTGRLRSVLSLKVSHKLDWDGDHELDRLIPSNLIDFILYRKEYPPLCGTSAAQLASRAPRLMEVFHTTNFRTIKDSLQ